MQADLHELKRRYVETFEMMGECAQMLGPDDYAVETDPTVLVEQDLDSFLSGLPEDGVKHQDFYSVAGVMHHLSGMIVSATLALEAASQADTLDTADIHDLLERPGDMAASDDLDDLFDGDAPDSSSMTSIDVESVGGDADEETDDA